MFLEVSSFVRVSLDPVPETYEHLRHSFYQETLETFRNIAGIVGMLYIISLIALGAVAYEPYLRLPETLVLDILNMGAGIVLVVQSRRLQTQAALFKLLFGCLLFALATNARESILLQNYMSLFLMAMTLAFVSMTFPWPPIWTVALQLLVMLSCSTMLFYWDASLAGPIMTVLILAFFSMAIQTLLTHQRWDSFLNRHHIQTLNAALKAHTDRLEEELILARRIQQGLLPPPSPTWPGLDVVCYSQPAFEVGGDFYSYHAFADGHVAVAVGDVSGKGVAAALLMATGLSLFASTLSRNLQPGGRLALLDEALAPYTQSQRQNCALCYVELNRDTMSVVNAGCIPPYIRRASGDIECPDVCGVALGQGLGARDGYQEVSTHLPSGDLVILTSDGVVEAQNATHELFGFERLEQAIMQGPASSAQAMLDHLLHELAAFVGNTQQHDDMTIVIFGVKAVEAD
jgi:serine phosphatase RsbU (regulator of sigma subunit)